MELQAIIGDKKSANDDDLVAINQLNEEGEDDDAIDADTKTEALIDEVFTELERREKSAVDRYPFTVNQKGTTLSFDLSTQSFGKYTYVFCLLISEYRRKTYIPSRIFHPISAEIEELFQVCSTVAAAGLLNGRAISFGFPRPDGSGFLEALRRTYEDLILEGKTEHKTRPGVSSKTKDGGIDIIAWRSFPDNLPGKLYLLGQCASGANYENKSIRSYLGRFHGDWFTMQPASPPLEALFVPFMLDHNMQIHKGQTRNEARHGHYSSLARDFGIIIDRCRLAYLVDKGMEIALQNSTWVERAGDMARIVAWVENVLRLLESDS